MAGDWVTYRDLARRDIELARRANANMLRCFSKTPVPATVEAADQVGILLQAESLASWYLERGEKEQARLKNITERAVLLYRNHPASCGGLCSMRMRRLNDLSTQT